MRFSPKKMTLNVYSFSILINNHWSLINMKIRKSINNKIYHTIGTISKFNQQIVETEAKSILSYTCYMTVDSRFDIRLLVLWTQTSHLVIELKMMQKCNITHANIENHRILIDTKISQMLFCTKQRWCR